MDDKTKHRVQSEMLTIAIFTTFYIVFSKFMQQYKLNDTEIYSLLLATIMTVFTKNVLIDKMKQKSTQSRMYNEAYNQYKSPSNYIAYSPPMFKYENKYDGSCAKEEAL